MENETGRREEIEITPAMLDAGRKEYLNRDSRITEEPEDIVARIFEAMLTASST